MTKHYGLPKDKLLVTVYHEDDQAFDLWKKIASFPDSKIIRIPTNANYWRMADVDLRALLGNLYRSSG